MMLALVGALLAGTLILFGFGNALGARGHHQRAADLAAVSAAQVMRDLYERLFEPPFLKSGVPNPRHLESRATSSSPAWPRSGAGSGTVCGFGRRTCVSPAMASRPRA
jgi:hypothetical protein